MSRTLESIDGICIHNSDSKDNEIIKNYDDVYDWHVNDNGWIDVGYDEIDEQAGGEWKAYRTSRLDKGLNSAAAYGHNDHLYHICMIGRFNEYAPTDAAYNFLANQIVTAMDFLPNVNSIDQIFPHSYFNNTACPGRYFDMGKLKALVAKLLLLRDEANEIMELPLDKHWAYEQIDLVRDAGIMNGDDKGFRPEDPVTRAELAATLVSFMVHFTKFYAAVKNWLRKTS